MRGGRRSGARIGRAALGLPGVGAAARRLAALRGRSLVLVYHRVAEELPSAPILIPTISASVFRRQVEALGEAGRIVPLEQLFARDTSDGPRFALTFDDDYPSHADTVLPVLRDLGAPATFFLSGRALHGAGPYWFETLERWIRHDGAREAATRLGLGDADPEALLLACERDPGLRSRVEGEPADGVRHLGADDVRELAGAGMRIGFHTVDHPALPGLPDPAVDDAVTRGRDELAAVVGAPLTLFAYPHGKADARTAGRVREAGYVAAWTGRPRPMRPGQDPHLLGRWEPGPLGPDELLVDATIRLTRSGRDR